MISEYVKNGFIYVGFYNESSSTFKSCQISKSHIIYGLWLTNLGTQKYLFPLQFLFHSKSKYFSKSALQACKFLLHHKNYTGTEKPSNFMIDHRNQLNFFNVLGNFSSFKFENQHKVALRHLFVSSFYFCVHSF